MGCVYAPKYRDRRGLGWIFGRGLLLRPAIIQGTECADWPDPQFLWRRPAEFWTSGKALQSNPALKPWARGESACLYNGMIAPLTPFAIRGVIWYQGEANVSDAHRYRILFPGMIASWRAEWGQGDFPFGFVQIAPWPYSTMCKISPTCCPEMWESQLTTLKSTPNTGMVVTTDIVNDLKRHPPKEQTGRGPPAGPLGGRQGLWPQCRLFGSHLQVNGR